MTIEVAWLRFSIDGCWSSTLPQVPNQTCNNKSKGYRWMNCIFIRRVISVLMSVSGNRKGSFFYSLYVSFLYTGHKQWGRFIFLEKPHYSSSPAQWKLHLGNSKPVVPEGTEWALGYRHVYFIIISACEKPETDLWYQILLESSTWHWEALLCSICYPKLVQISYRIGFGLELELECNSARYLLSARYLSLEDKTMKRDRSTSICHRTACSWWAVIILVPPHGVCRGTLPLPCAVRHLPALLGAEHLQVELAEGHQITLHVPYLILNQAEQVGSNFEVFFLAPCFWGSWGCWSRSLELTKHRHNERDAGSFCRALPYRASICMELFQPHRTAQGNPWGSHHLWQALGYTGVSHHVIAPWLGKSQRRPNGPLRVCFPWKFSSKMVLMDPSQSWGPYTQIPPPHRTSASSHPSNHRIIK